MRKVLFIAYYFPPIGGGGVQRSVKFVKYLPQFGFMPIVLTAGTSESERWAPRDEALLCDLPDESRVHRVSGLPPVQTGRSWERRLRNACHLPSAFGVAWWRAIVREGAWLCAQERPDLIYVSLSPFEGATAAAELSRRFGIPWVADLRDPWALDEMQVHMSGVHRRVARRYMRRALRGASSIIMNTPESARRLVTAFPEYRRRRVGHLTNGFDAADFAGLMHRPDPHVFRIVHTGSLHTQQGRYLAGRRRWFERLGRIEPGVDFLTRSHVNLLEALRLWRLRDARVTRHVRLILAGSLTAADRAETEQSPVRDLVTIDGYRSHAETVQLQKDAEVLFLPMHNVAPGQRASIVPGKTYEYLATGRPILAAVPAGDARDFVTGAGTGLICEPDDVQEMVALLQEQFRAWSVGAAVHPVSHAYLRQFERRELTRKLANEFHRLLREPQNASTVRPGGSVPPSVAVGAQPADGSFESSVRGPAPRAAWGRPGAATDSKGDG